MTPDNCTIGESTAILVFDIMRDPDAILDRPVTVEFFTDSGTASGTQKHWFGLLYVVCVCVCVWKRSSTFTFLNWYVSNISISRSS